RSFGRIFVPRRLKTSRGNYAHETDSPGLDTDSGLGPTWMLGLCSSKTLGWATWLRLWHGLRSKVLHPPSASPPRPFSAGRHRPRRQPRPAPQAPGTTPARDFRPEPKELQKPLRDPRAPAARHDG